MKPKNKKMLVASLESIDLSRMVSALESAKDEEILAAMLTRLKNEITYMWELATDNTLDDKMARELDSNWGRLNDYSTR